MNQNLTEKELKSQAHILRDYLESCGVDVKHTQVLEGLARVHGWRNFATARANFLPSIVEHSEQARQGWVERIMWYGSWWNDCMDDEYYVFPVGSTLDNADADDLHRLRRIPEHFRFDPATTCLEHVYAEVASMAHYGTPTRANARDMAKEYAKDGFGVAKDGPSVRIVDRQDDGAENYWLQVWMPKEASDALDKAVVAASVSVLAELIRDRAERNEFAVTRSTLEELAFEECNQFDMGEPTKEELNALRAEFGF